jgi:DNA-binding beta-propeller fold protein YncE
MIVVTRAIETDEGDNSTAPWPAAPGFSGATGWLNTEKPIELTDLRGQVVLLDFWTYCCINCLHVLPDLKFLEEKYRDQPFVVIGVHSGKFDQEKDEKNIRQAILRHNIDHPVAVDSDYKIWTAFGVGSWPTLVLIDPEGNIAGAVSGEGHRNILDKKIATLLAEHKAKGTLKKPMRFRREREGFESEFLEFPGKVLADAAGKRLFISDTNHHRIVVTNFDGKVLAIIGDGTIGLVDGDYASARFHQPQGLALSRDGRTLYVADTQNHALRSVDLKSKRVTTMAGNGKQNVDRNPRGPAARTGLNSPWALALVDDKLYMAMAGPHQIWQFDLKSKVITRFAGSGGEGGMDGPNKRAVFAQPSGLATDGKRLFVADSETSSIRTVGLGTDGRTETLAGSGKLFGYGFHNDVGKKARFQHALGVALDGNDLYVADTYNHLIRKVDIVTGRVTKWLGIGKPQRGNESRIGFSEPSGLSIANGTLYIADTNNHRIVAVEIATKKVCILKITGEK